jgi:VWFA-related protein
MMLGRAVFFASLLSVCFGGSLLAQKASGPPQDVVTLKATARSVIVDVVVSDKNNRPVKGLTREIFHISENDKAQEINFFEESEGVPTLHPQKPVTLPPNVFTNLNSTKSTGPLNVLLLDSLNTAFSDQSRARTQMLQYLRSLPKGTSIAVFALGDELQMVRGFSNDPLVVADALSDPKALPQSSLLLGDGLRGSVTNNLADIYSASPMLDPDNPFQHLGLQSALNQDSIVMDKRVSITLAALNELGMYLSRMPGRKNLIWLSGSFPIEVDPVEGNKVERPFDRVRDYTSQITETTNALAGAEVAIYPLDVRGGMTPSAYDGAHPPEEVQGVEGVRGPPIRGSSDLREFSQKVAEHATMTSLADGSGGIAIFEMNSLDSAIAKMMEHGNHYYRIAYTPSGPEQAGSFRKIHVVVDNGKEYRLSYRRGYFDEGPEKARARQAQKDVLPGWMLRGAPDETAVGMEVRILPIATTTTKEEASAHGSKPDPSRDDRAYRMDYLIDIHKIPMTMDGSGIRHGSAHVTAIAYDDKGAVVRIKDDVVKFDITEEQYRQYLRAGFHYFQIMNLPPGRLEVRFGVAGVPNQGAGTIEVRLEVPKKVEKAMAIH